jgi:hypothetical protein
MLNLSCEAIKEFQEIWKREFREQIDNELAVTNANKLINLFSAIYRPIPNPKIVNVEVKKD